MQSAAELYTTHLRQRVLHWRGLCSPMSSCLQQAFGLRQSQLRCLLPFGILRALQSGPPKRNLLHLWQDQDRRCCPLRRSSPRMPFAMLCSSKLRASLPVQLSPGPLCALCGAGQETVCRWAYSAFQYALLSEIPYMLCQVWQTSGLWPPSLHSPVPRRLVPC